MIRLQKHVTERHTSVLGDLSTDLPIFQGMKQSFFHTDGKKKPPYRRFSGTVKDRPLVFCTGRMHHQTAYPEDLFSITFCKIKHSCPQKNLSHPTSPTQKEVWGKMGKCEREGSPFCREHCPGLTVSQGRCQTTQTPYGHRQQGNVSFPLPKNVKLASRCCVPIGCSPFPHSVSWKLADKPTSERGKG